MTIKKTYNKEPEELSPDMLKGIYENSLFYTTTEVEEQKPCIWIQESDFKSTIASFGNISVVVGKPKAGKTFVITAIVAALLKNDTCLKFNGSLSPEKSKVLYIDTEQSKRDCKKVAERISILTGTPGQHPEKLIYMRLRGIVPSIIVQVIDWIVNHNDEIGVVIIDGIKDLVYSINDERESTEISAKLLHWSEAKAIHIITVIHQNKIDLNTRGHIGTELENKSESVLTVEKDSNDKGLIVVKAKLMRNQEFDSFAFRIIDGLPVLSDFAEIIETKKSKNPQDYDEDTHRNILSTIFPENNNCTNRELNMLLIAALRKYGISVSEKPCRNFVNYYLEKRFIEDKGTDGKQKLIYNVLELPL